nr:hypothetical protein [uncultured Celeribacter sp.]
MKNATCLAVGVALSILATPALADCADNMHRVLSCDLGDKTLDLCLDPYSVNLLYRFGPPGAPELELIRPLSSATYVPWPGIGRAIWEQVTLTNYEASYEVFWMFDKIDRLEKGGVIVTSGEELLAELHCTSSPEQDFETLYQAYQVEGYCRGMSGQGMSLEACE